MFLTYSIIILWAFISGTWFYGWVDEDYNRRQSFEPVMYGLVLLAVILTTIRITLMFAS